MMDAFELPTTLVQALRRRAVQEPERLALRFLAEDDGEGVVLSFFGQLKAVALDQFFLGQSWTKVAIVPSNQANGGILQTWRQLPVTRLTTSTRC
ncbi:hypothetical protein ACSES7_27080 [Pseudomonas aeruginosa]